MHAYIQYIYIYVHYNFDSNYDDLYLNMRIDPFYGRIYLTYEIEKQLNKEI